MIKLILLVGLVGIFVISAVFIVLGIRVPKVISNRLGQKKILFIRTTFIGGGVFTIVLLSFCFIKYSMDMGIALMAMADEIMIMTGRLPPHSAPHIRLRSPLLQPTNPILPPIYMITQREIEIALHSLENAYKQGKIKGEVYKFRKKYLEDELANIFFFQNPSNVLKESREWKNIECEERKIWWQGGVKNPKRLMRKINKWLVGLEKKGLINKTTLQAVKKHFERLSQGHQIFYQISYPEPYTSFLQPIFSITIKNDLIVRLADKDKVLYARLYGVVLDYDGIEYGHLPFELSEKEEQIKRLVKKVLSEQTSTVGTLEGKKTFEDEIKRKINEILDEGQIESVYIKELLIQ